MYKYTKPSGFIEGIKIVKTSKLKNHLDLKYYTTK